MEWVSSDTSSILIDDKENNLFIYFHRKDIAACYIYEDYVTLWFVNGEPLVLVELSEEVVKAIKDYIKGESANAGKS